MRSAVQTRRQAARDRRNAAIHESGHIIIGRKVGLKVLSAWIAPTDKAHPDEKIWIGRTQFTTDPARFRAQHRRMVGVAGAVAEYIWSGLDDPIDSMDWYSPEAMSAADWQLAGCEPGNPTPACMLAIEEAATLLARDGSLWSELLSVARKLMIASR